MAEDASRRSRGPWMVLGATIVATTLVRLRLLGVPLERDEGEYAYLGQLILQGETPYLAAHNMKLPGVYYAYAAILGLLGETDVAIRTGLLAINLASVALVYHLGRRLLHPAGGAAAAAIFAALSLSESVLGFTANAEHFVVLPMLAGAVLLAGLGRRRALARVAAAGLFFGLAIVMKQQGAAFAMFGAALLLAKRRAPAECLAFGSAALAPFGLTCLGLYAAGAFEPFWFWTVTYAREYIAVLSLADGLELLRRQAIALAIASPGLWALAATGMVTTWRVPTTRAAAPFVLGLALAGAAAVVPGLRFSEHYFLLVLPAASLLAAAALDALGPRTATARIVVLSVALLLGAVRERGYLFVRSPVAVARATYGANPFPEAVRIADHIAAQGPATDRIAVIGSEPQIYFYARRHAATSFIYMYPLMEPHPFARQMQDEMIAQLERERPRFIVMVNVPTSWTIRPASDRHILAWAARTVEEAYVPIGLADIDPGGETTYRWGVGARDARPRSPYFVVTFERR